MVYASFASLCMEIDTENMQRIQLVHRGCEYTHSQCRCGKDRWPAIARNRVKLCLVLYGVTVIRFGNMKSLVSLYTGHNAIIAPANNPISAETDDARLSVVVLGNNSRQQKNEKRRRYSNNWTV